MSEAMEAVSCCDGTLSLKEFCVAAHTFAEKWKRINSASYPPWLWINPPKQPFIASQQVEGFLSLENICLHGLDHNLIDNSVDEANCFKADEDDLSAKEEAIDNDDATLVHCNHHEVQYYDFHIVYSASFRVPVLYFRGYYSDGRPLQLNEIEKNLPTCSAKVLLESKWTFITQEEHPYLNRPWYKLHPCGTSEWMRLLYLGAKKSVAIELYLVSWFSVVGQVISLRIPIEMVNDHTTVSDD